MRTRSSWLARAALVAAAVLAAPAGCHRGGKAADCKAVAGAYATLLRQQIEHDPPDARSQKQREEALSLIPLLKEQMAAECKTKKWSAGTRQCIVEARTEEDLARCDANPPPPEVPGKEQPASPAGAGGAAPAGETGGTEGTPAGGSQPAAPGSQPAAPGSQPAAPGSQPASPGASGQDTP